MKLRRTILILLTCLSSACTSVNQRPKSISGIYPHLAFYNNEGECGTGAVVPWANRLWVITYGPHLPFGSSDKLYEITPDLKRVVRPESIGGTPANRMIHNESKQLFIGPYAIDKKRQVRVIPYNVMPGRLTGNARHLTDPVGKLYCATMEEGFYEIDVNSLDVNTLYADGNNPKGGLLREQGKGSAYAELPGAHGKGLYSGQGILVFSNNGENNRYSTTKFDIESGSLSEWDGKSWKVIRRNQFVEITGPGGILGNKNPDTDPIWATGWDYKSLILGVREPAKGWTFYRLPKASNTYDGAHGWNTEWPRIRDVGTEKHPDYLMTMHGMFWRFPSSFTTTSSKGIAPRSAYLKVVGDFTRWNNRLVFGCDDAAEKEFLNKRIQKGSIEGAGQSNSNLWFTTPSYIDSIGPTNAAGAVWQNESVMAGAASEPMLFEGWKRRAAWVKNSGSEDISLTLEVDIDGSNQWTKLKQVHIPKGESDMVPFDDSEKGVWIRAVSDRDAVVSLSFVYGSHDGRAAISDRMFDGLAAAEKEQALGGLLWGLPNDRRSMGLYALSYNGVSAEPAGYYELDQELNLRRKEDTITAAQIRDKFAIPQQVVKIDRSSVLVIDDKGRRWRLPLGSSNFERLTNAGMLRICREVSTERDLFSSMGTFYELPAENADGFAKIRPVSTHGFRINDFASYRGMLVMTGISPDYSGKNQHVIISDDKKAAVWVGAIDDLWKLGKPVGYGGPWLDEPVAANTASDPYLIGFYDRRTITLSHDSSMPVRFTIEVDPLGNGDWIKYSVVEVNSKESKRVVLPDSFQARWIRFSVDKDCKATTTLVYS